MRVATNLMIPLLAVLLLAAGRREPRTVLFRLAIALTWAYLLHFTDRSLRLWAGRGLDYSTHTAVAIAVGFTLARLGAAWAVASFAVLLAYAALMVHVGYHSVEDILTTAMVNLPVAMVAQLLPRRRPAEA